MESEDECRISEMQYNFFGDLLITGSFSGLLSGYKVKESGEHELNEQVDLGGGINCMQCSGLI